MRTTCLISRQVGGRVVRTAAHGGAGKRETERIHRPVVGRRRMNWWRRVNGRDGGGGGGGGRVKGERKGGSVEEVGNEGMGVLNGWKEEGGGEHLTGVPDRVTSLLPFPPTWYNVLEVFLSAASPRNDRAEGTEDAFGFETSSQFYREGTRKDEERKRESEYIYICRLCAGSLSSSTFPSCVLSLSLSSRLWP